MPGRHVITVYGANGYTGRQVARELLARGAHVVLSGRSREKLLAVAEELDGDVEVSAAALDDREALRTAAGKSAAVLNCAGPFWLTCEPVARAAIEVGVHYLDVSAEQLSAAWVFGEGDGAGRTAGVALMPSTAFYSLLSDLAVELTAASSSPDEVRVAYKISGWRPSAASVLGRLEGMRREWFEYDGGLQTRRGWPRTTWFDFPDPVGRRRVGVYPTPEAFTIPRHTSATRVRTHLTTSTLTPAALGRFLPLIANTSARLMHTPARPLVEGALTRSWRSYAPDGMPHDSTKFLVVVRVSGPDGEREAWLSGKGIYDMTAPIAAKAAVRLLDGGAPGTGALAPAEVFDAREFLDALRPYGLAYEVGGKRITARDAGAGPRGRRGDAAHGLSSGATGAPGRAAG